MMLHQWVIALQQDTVTILCSIAFYKIEILIYTTVKKRRLTFLDCFQALVCVIIFYRSLFLIEVLEGKMWKI